MKKNNSKIDLIIMTLLLVKCFLDLLDFEEVRYTQTDTQNMFYWAMNSFAVMIFQIFINILMDMKIVFPMTVISVIFI
jgi:hypothetical protein